MKHIFTLGIEEEYQIIDPETRELRSHVSKIIEGGQAILKERIKSEMHQAVIEMETGICMTAREAGEEIKFLRKNLLQIAAAQGLAIGAAGTHPFSHWYDQDITENPRYAEIVNEMRDVARSNLIFGLHVHVGIPDRTEGLRLMNVVRYFLPHIYALSTNSPFWVGRNTGFKSYRSKVFDKFPRTGIPPYFGSVGEYDNFIDLLIKTNSIDNAKKIWWDVRLHPVYPTLEFRMCDIPMRLEETICIAALCQAVTAKVRKLHLNNLDFRGYRRALIAENKWRAARYGTEAMMIDFGQEKERPFNELIIELLEFIDDVVDELDCRKEVNYVHQILTDGTGADRQLSAFDKRNDLKDVVDLIISETAKGL
ncbi:MAG: carboxylate-amine ligase [Flavobacteriaceae bacterium]|nr:carboxylate-amine ligase [Flavobacteriaceae bacterium]